MKFPAMALIVALSCVTLHGEANNIRGSAAPVTVFTQFDHEHSPAVTEVMKTELAAIMAPIGLEFEWRSIEAPRSDRAAVELVVVAFKGSCRMEEVLRPHGDEAGALGWTHTSDGVVLPFSDIDCDHIRRFIGREVAHAPLHEREMLLGRAVGRVLAHELYHVFANTKQHGKQGVAKPFYTASELVSDRFLFEQKETRALRTLALPALIRARGPLPAATALTAK
jgi:hypothetical protein